MVETLTPCHAFEQVGLLPGHLGLRLDPVFQDVTEACAKNTSDLELALENLELELPCGQKTVSPYGLLIRHWPDRFWALTDASSRPVPSELRPVAVGHGQFCIRLSGRNCLYFLAHYCGADLFDETVLLSQTLRARIGTYNTLLWWDDASEIYIALERSLGQSFCDHLAELAIRHAAPEMSLSPIQKPNVQKMLPF
ncbi:MAG: hypothetical protein GY947_08320 [Rhodobacteraceae bacterium]|nr:hypothetical protein [Paracoccaceae bacterium]